MAESYLFDKNRILPCAAKLTKGEWGVKGDFFVGVPAKINGEGVTEVIEVALTEEESNNLNLSIDAVKDLVKAEI
jgi:malate dehydrogenase